MAKTDLEVMQDHFLGLPGMLDLHRPTDIVAFAELVDGEMFLDRASIMTLHRLGYIPRRPEDGVYYWPHTMRHPDAWVPDPPAPGRD